MKYFDNNIKYIYNKNGSDTPQLTKYCEWKGCNEKGIHKAPRNREYLREFRWFCLEHVREYNNKWNYFSGLSQIEIEKELKADFSWHLPTWPMSENLNNKNIKDDFEVLDSTKNVNKISNLENSKETKALRKLGLTLDSSLQDIKRRYKILVKKHHPDTNTNKKKSNNILIEINEAYKILLKTIKQ
tara:strand:- start:1912 stop:2469 length:558 start_codon:yes stop_codon:yes gene_type:complete